LLGGDDFAEHRRAGDALGGQPRTTQRHVDCLIQPLGPGHDLMRGAAGHRLGAQIEGLAGAGVGQIDGHHHGHTQGDADDHQDALPRVAQQIAPADAQQRFGGKGGCGHRHET